MTETLQAIIQARGRSKGIDRASIRQRVSSMLQIAIAKFMMVDVQLEGLFVGEHLRQKRVKRKIQRCGGCPLFIRHAKDKESISRRI